MALPPGLIQIKGRRGYYVNITVPNALRKAIGRAFIQKKAGDTLEAEKRVLVEEQLKARQLFDQHMKEDGPKQLRKLCRQLKGEDTNQTGPDDTMLTAEEAIDLIVDSKVNIRVDPEDP